MEVSASLKNARISPYKVRLVADQIRGLSVAKAIDTLSFSLKKGAALVKKVLDSAIANAEHNEGADVDDLKIKSICVDESVVLKRMHARAKGRGNQILKRSCHITILVSDSEEK